MPAASGCTTSKLRSSLWIFRVISRRSLRFMWCQLFCNGRQIAFLFFCGCLDFMRIFHGEFNSARPGRRPLHSLSIGVRPLSFQNNAATIYTIASTGAMLLYRARTRQRRYAALAAESRCASDFKFAPSCLTLITHFAHTVSESHNHPDGVALAPFPQREQPRCPIGSL